MIARRFLTATLLAGLLALSGCGDGGPAPQDAAGRPDSGGPPSDAGQTRDTGEPPADGGDGRAITIRFRAQFGARPYRCDGTYAGQGSTAVEIEPRTLRFYVQDLRLVTAGGDEVPVEVEERGEWQLPEVSFLDFDNVGGCRPGRAVNEVVTGRVPPGEYTGVAFSNGVPHAINHADPVTLTGPLRAPGTHWNWITGFRFFMAEVIEVGAASADGDAGAADEDAGVAGVSGGVLHVGSVGCSGSPARGDVECSRPNRNRVRLDDFDPDRDVIVADLAALFAETDLSQISACHGSDPACGPMLERFGVDRASGEPLSTQRIYRVEREGEAEP